MRVNWSKGSLFVVILKLLYATSRRFYFVDLGVRSVLRDVLGRGDRIPSSVMLFFSFFFFFLRRSIAARRCLLIRREGFRWLSHVPGRE